MQGYRLAGGLLVAVVSIALASRALAADTASVPKDGTTDLPVPALPWYKVKAPPLPAPTGKVVEVKTADELLAACKAPAEGSTIMIADGTYEMPKRLWLVGLKGVAIRGKSGDRNKVILDGSRLDRAHAELLTLGRDCADVTIADLTIQNCAVHGITFKGEGNTQRPTVYNCRIRNVFQRYIKGTSIPNKDGKDAATIDPAVLKTRPTGGHIQYCLFEQDHKKDTTDDIDNGNYIAGMDMMWLKDWVISDNVFLNIQGRTGGGRGAIFLWNNCEDVVIERNVIVGCDRGICLGNPSGGSSHMTRGVVRNNFIARGTDKAIEIVRTRDCQIYNNSIWSADANWARTIHVFQGAAGDEIFNNLVRGKILVEGNDAKRVANNLSGECDGFFVAPEKGEMHLTAKGAEAARGKGSAVPEGAKDFDGKPRPATPAPGACEP